MSSSDSACAAANQPLNAAAMARQSQTINANGARTSRFMMSTSRRPVDPTSQLMNAAAVAIFDDDTEDAGFAGVVARVALCPDDAGDDSDHWDDDGTTGAGG